MKLLQVQELCIHHDFQLFMGSGRFSEQCGFPSLWPRIL